MKYCPKVVSTAGNASFRHFVLYSPFPLFCPFHLRNTTASNITTTFPFSNLHSDKLQENKIAYSRVFFFFLHGEKYFPSLIVPSVIENRATRMRQIHFCRCFGPQMILRLKMKRCKELILRLIIFNYPRQKSLENIYIRS